MNVFSAMQCIYLGQEGNVIYSCDRIFPASPHAGSGFAFLEHFPLLESIFSDLLTLKLGSQPVVFKAVHSTFPKLPGYYDFSFEMVFDKPLPIILWIIYDRTDDYINHQKIQQAYNEQEIRNNEVEQ